MWSHSFYQHIIKGFKSILSASPVRKTLVRSSICPLQRRRRNEAGSCLHLQPAVPHCCLLPDLRGRLRGCRRGRETWSFLGFVPLGSSAGLHVPQEPEPLEGSALEGCKLLFFSPSSLRARGGGGTVPKGDKRSDPGVCTWGRLRAWMINPGETQPCTKGWQQAAVPARNCRCLQHEEEGRVPPRWGPRQGMVASGSNRSRSQPRLSP